jgi:AcrR family transcriptional regulator
MNQATAPDKDLIIAQAALRAFALYGYRRASMEDIAQGAGMSRAALYLRFKNKEDIFRSLVRHYYASGLADMAAALSHNTPDAETALNAAVLAKNGAVMELLLTSPHGHELLDAGFAIGADIVAEGEARMTALLADFFAARGLAAGYGTPQSFARMVMAALKGLKTSAADYDALLTSQQQLVRLIAQALGPAER